MTKINYTKRQLRSRLRMIDKRLNQFVSILCDDYPELKLGLTGSVLFNSYEIDMDKSVAKEALSKYEYKDWEKLRSHG